MIWQIFPTRFFQWGAKSYSAIFSEIENRLRQILQKTAVIGDRWIRFRFQAWTPFLNGGHSNDRKPTVKIKRGIGKMSEWIEDVLGLSHLYIFAGTPLRYSWEVERLQGG